MLHPKVKAGAQAGALASAVIVVLSLIGVEPSDGLEQTLTVVLAAVIPIFAGWLKSA